MTKVAMAAVLIGAFGYAVWLAATRRTVPVRGSGGRRRVFLLMTLYFLAWLGVPLAAGEPDSPGPATEIAADETQKPAAALRDSWAVLGMLNRTYLVGILGEGEELEAFRRDKARYDETSSIFDKHAWEPYSAMRMLEDCAECSKDYRFGRGLCEHETDEQREDRLARHEAAKKEYEPYAQQYERPFREQQRHMSRTWWGDLKADEQYLELARSRFDAALQEERAGGRIGEGAAALLEMVYKNMAFHLRRMQATCYMGPSREYKPRSAIGSAVRRIAQANLDGKLDAEAFAAAERDLAREIGELKRIGFENGYKYVPVRRDTDGSGDRAEEIVSYRKPDGMDEEVAEKMRDPDLAAAIGETARVIAVLAREMPSNWGDRQKE